MKYILTEQQLEFIFEQQLKTKTYQTAPSDATQTMRRMPSGSMAQSNPFKSTDMGYSRAQKPVDYDWDQLFEGLKEAAYSPAGIATSVMLGMIPQLKASPMLIFGSVLAWDIHKSIETGQTRWFWIILDCLMILSEAKVAGYTTSFKALIDLAKTSKSVMTLTEIFVAILKIPGGKLILKSISLMSEVAAFLVRNLIKSLNFLLEKTGLKWLFDGLSKFGTWIENLIVNFSAKAKGFISEMAAKVIGKGANVYVQNQLVSTTTKQIIYLYDTKIGPLRRLGEFNNIIPTPQMFTEVKKLYPLKA